MQELNEVAKALDVLAKRGLLYGGFRKRLRRIVEVRATPTELVIKYEDGDLQYVYPTLTRRFIVYTRPPKQ
jgi:uncharacterized protein YutE (UPF0331/DUF86 family)